MKKILFALMIMLLPIGASADFLGIKKVDEFIAMRVITLDSAGIRTKPDSVHIFTYLDGGTALQFNTRNITYPFDAVGIDTSKIYGDTTYWFVDQIQDIDGTPTPADYTLTINIVMWGDGGIPTDNWGTVQILGDSLDVYLAFLDALISSRLAPTVASRTLDVTAGGNAGIDWNNVETPGATVSLSATTVNLVTTTTTATTATTVTNLAANAIGVGDIATGAITADAIATDAIGSAELATSAADEMADEVWDELVSGHAVALSFGDSLIQTIFSTGVKVSLIGADVITATSIQTDAIGALEIAAGAITSSEAPNLDAAVSSRLAKADSVEYMNVKSMGGQANTTSPANLNEAFDGDATGSGRISVVESLNDLADSSIDAAAIKSNSLTTTKFAGSFLTADLLDGTVREEIWNIPFSDVAVAAGSMWDSLNNSTYVQGSAGLDSSSLAGWVWNTPQSNHTTAGTFGKYLDTEISGLGSGSGAYSYQLVTYDSTTSQVIPGTNLAVRNINQSALIATGKSNLLGLETFNLDADSFIIIATSPGYIYPAFDTLIVTGAGIDTVFGDQFDPGSPVSPALCRVYGYLYSVSAVPEKDAVVRAYLPAGVAQSGNLIISPFMVTTTSDSSGYFFLDLIRSDSLVPAATQYDLIIERSDGTIVHKRITVPDSTSWQLDW